MRLRGAVAVVAVAGARAVVRRLWGFVAKADQIRELGAAGVGVDGAAGGQDVIDLLLGPGAVVVRAQAILSGHERDEGRVRGVSVGPPGGVEGEACRYVDDGEVRYPSPSLSLFLLCMCRVSDDQVGFFLFLRVCVCARGVYAPLGVFLRFAHSFM